MADVAGGREARRDRQARAGVPTVEDVVRRLAPAREAPDPAELAERPEPRVPAGQQLVRIGLVAGVPDDPVAGRLEDPVQRQRDLNDAERRAKMAAGGRDGGDDRAPDLLRQLQEPGFAEAAKVARALESWQDRDVLAPSYGVLGAPPAAAFRGAPRGECPPGRRPAGRLRESTPRRRGQRRAASPRTRRPAGARRRRALRAPPPRGAGPGARRRRGAAHSAAPVRRRVRSGRSSAPAAGHPPRAPRRSAPAPPGQRRTSACRAPRAPQSTVSPPSTTGSTSRAGPM